MRPLALALVLLAITAVSCGGTGDDSAGPPPEVSTGSRENEPATGRTPAPAVVGVDLDGAPIALRDFRGQPVLVNVWSSW